MSYNQRRTIGTGVPAVGKQFLSKLIKDFIFYNHSGLVSSLPTTSRTTDLTIPDHEGILRTFGNGEVGIEGGRVVENLIDSSEDLTSGTWTVDGGGGTTTIDSAEVVSFAAGTDSSNRLTYLSSIQREGQVFRMTVDIPASANWSDPTATITLRDSQATGNITITAPTEVTRYSVLFSPFSAGTLVILFWSDKATTLTGITNFQLENVTGQANQNPSEYVSSTIGKQVYATANGNTVV